jgi:peptidoglycan/xylan/chitin deacetylase (PgdA/CDA1 family)
MYHYISIPPEDADQYRLDLSVSPEAFREQMTYLHQQGYNTIDLYDLSRAIADKQELPPKPIIITLDDGYRDNYENAFPVLEEYGMTATFFVVTDFIDRGHPDYMTWPMIDEMARSGMRFEPHSKSHPDLRGQDREFVIFQLLGSRETLEAHLDYRPRYFAYPSGRYDDQVLAIVEELDYWGAVTTAGGIWHGFNDRFEWTRVRIRNVTSLEEFADFVG